MPTTYTHYRFGKDVLENLPEPFNAEARFDRELFDIGLHGPDIFFYYKPFVDNPVNMRGKMLHDQYADGFFTHAASVIGKSNGRSAAGARAYIYGFICHFALDSAMHGYIEKIVRQGGISHAAAERELDRFLMEQDGLDPATYLPTGHIKANKKNAEAIARFFEDIDPRTMEKALLSMRRILSLLLPSGPLKKPAVSCILKAAGCYDTHIGLFMLKEADGKCARYLDTLFRVYKSAVPDAASLIISYHRFLSGKEGLSRGFHKTFGAGAGWEGLEL